MSDDLIATQYRFRAEFEAFSDIQVSFDRTNGPSYKGERWAVRRLGRVLSRRGQWEWEPQPSSRDDSFYVRCRFRTREAAVKTYKGRDVTCEV